MAHPLTQRSSPSPSLAALWSAAEASDSFRSRLTGKQSDSIVVSSADGMATMRPCVTCRHDMTPQHHHEGHACR
jgi:hypothetical protein